MRGNRAGGRRLNRAAPVAVCACVLVAVMAGCGPKAPETLPHKDTQWLEHRFSRDYAVLVMADDVAGCKVALEQTGLWATWHDPAIQALLEQQLKQAEKGVQEAVGLSSKELLASLPGQVVFGLAPPPAGSGEDDPRMALLIRLNAATGNAERLLGHIRAKAGDDIEKGSLLDGTPFEKFDDKIFLATKGDLLALATSELGLAEVLAEPGPAETRLVETERFKATMKPFGAPRAESLYAYVDLASVFARMGAMDDMDTNVRTIIDQLGYQELKALGMAVRPAGASMRTDVHLYAPGWTTGVFKPFGQDARALLKTVPASAIGAAAARFDYGALYDLVARAVSGVYDEEFDEAIKKANDYLGADLRRDVIGALGSECVIYFLAPADPPISVVPPMVIEMPLTQRDGIVTALDKLGGELAEYLKGQAAGIQYAREEKDGVIWYNVWGLVPLPFQVSVALAEKRLVIGTRKDQVAAAVARGGKPLAEHFLDKPAVVEALDRLGGDGAEVGYIETKPILNALYVSLAPILQNLMAGAGQEKLPKAEDLFKHLTPTAFVLKVTPDGLIYTGESFSGVSSFLSTMLLGVSSRPNVIAGPKF